MSNVRIADPAVEPVSVDDFKLFAKIDSTSEDALIEETLKAAREHFELTTGLALIEQTWRLGLDMMPGSGGREEPWWDGVRDGAISELYSFRNWIELPTAPLLSISSFKSYAGDNSFQTFTGYYADIDARPGRLLLNTGAVWPVSTRSNLRYTIEYVAGFGSDADNVPSDIKQCIKMITAHWMENREIMTFDTAAVKVPAHADRIMQRRKLRRL